jgi:hypothetical protein
MQVKKTIFSFLSVFLGLFASVNAQSQNLASARILSSSGPVEIQRRSQGEASLSKITYRVNDELLAGDVIKTYVGGRLVLGLVDGSQAIIGEKTVVEIVDLSKTPRTIFNVLRGKTRIKIEKVGGRPNPYRVNTPTTVIAVRGTLFDVLVTDKETQVFVHEGEVAVSNFAKPEILVVLSPGQKTRVQQTQPPEPPSHFRPGRNDGTFQPKGREGGPNESQRSERRADQQSEDQQKDDRRRQSEQPARDQNNPAQKQPEDRQRQNNPPHSKADSRRNHNEESIPEQFLAGNRPGS